MTPQEFYELPTVFIFDIFRGEKKSFMDSNFGFNLYFLTTCENFQLYSLERKGVVKISICCKLFYHQQGNRSNLKIHFFRLRGVSGGP